jgi:CRISPR/Cas system Type II protein with McrA/HNH and RuvC-like nuclease domain
VLGLIFPTSLRMKIDRQLVYQKCNGRCAYCGVEIDIKQMQVDHIQPHWHTITEQESKKYNITKGSHDIENLNPSCSRCNKWKSTYNLEQFRKVVETSLMRLNRDTPNFRLARDYGLLTETPKQIKFYFEIIN